MSSTSTTFNSTPADEGDFQYQALSTSAIASLIFGSLSFLTLLAGRESLESCLQLTPIPLIGVIVGWRALRSIRAMPDQLSGEKLALVGLILSGIGLVGGLGFASYVHITEVPPNHIRTSFQDFRPNEAEERADVPIPKDIQALDGKKVFIKGFMRPETSFSGSTPSRHNVTDFLLVRDNNQCCFGDLASVKFYDQILVHFVDKATTNYSSGLFRIAGTLHVNPENLNRGPGHPVYSIEANYVR